jgi:hypothetical protein
MADIYRLDNAQDDLSERRYRRRRGIEAPPIPEGALARLPDDDREIVRVARGLLDICRDGHNGPGRF